MEGIAGLEGLGPSVGVLHGEPTSGDDAVVIGQARLIKAGTGRPDVTELHEHEGRRAKERIAREHPRTADCLELRRRDAHR